MLLTELLRSIPPSLSVIAIMDERMMIPKDILVHVQINRIKPSLLGRLFAEYHLKREATGNDCVLCFGNLPPLFRVKGNVSVFLQNRYLVELVASFGSLPLKTRLRLMLERIWLSWNRGKATRYFVQTPTMRRLTQERLGVQAEFAPFIPDSVMKLAESPVDGSSLQFDFIYVASGDTHKNHMALIRAWGILADEGVFPSLALTLKQETADEVLKKIKAESASRGLKIQNLGEIEHDRLIELYRSCGALIYPSSFESLGLPLIEARKAGLAVLAPELDYVRDITDPEETFEPRSPVSIARAVKRYMKECKPAFEPITASSFVDQLVQDQAP